MQIRLGDTVEYVGNSIDKIVNHFSMGLRGKVIELDEEGVSVGDNPRHFWYFHNIKKVGQKQLTFVFRE